MSDQPTAVPLSELLRAVPRYSRLLIEGDEPNFPSCTSIPVGSHAHQAADEIDYLKARIATLEGVIATMDEALRPFAVDDKAEGVVVGRSEIRKAIAARNAYIALKDNTP